MKKLFFKTLKVKLHIYSFVTVICLENIWSKLHEDYLPPLFQVAGVLWCTSKKIRKSVLLYGYAVFFYISKPVQW